MNEEIIMEEDFIEEGEGEEEEECVEVSYFDPDYEYDSARFFDFTKPESISETVDAERWFEFAPSYPPSPFIVKLNWGKAVPVKDAGASINFEHANASLKSEVDIDPKVSESEENNQGCSHIGQHIMKAKTKSMAKSPKPRSSTLMKPTASHLAKQNKLRDSYLNQFRGRSQKPFTNVDERNLLNSFGVESEATKRQKLESGYLLKVAHLKHQTLLLHKKAKKLGPNDANPVHARAKVTIPREPDLETAHRAHRRRSKNSSESGEQAKQNAYKFKARPLNRKILEVPSLPLPKKSTRQLPDFQVFHLKTMERAMQHSSANVLNLHNSDFGVHCTETDFIRPQYATKQEKCETSRKFKASPFNKKIFLSRGDTVVRSIKQEAMDYQFSIDKGLSQNPPIALFNKLSLKSEQENNSIPQPKQHLSTKGSKENSPSPFQLQYLSIGKPNQCECDGRFPETGPQPNMNRRLGIR